MRTIDHRIIVSELKGFDDALKNTLDAILGSTLTNREFEKITLTIQNGGHGVRTSLDNCQAAYLSSETEAKTFVSEYLAIWP